MWNDPAAALVALEEMPDEYDLDPPHPGLPFVSCSGRVTSPLRREMLATLAYRAGDVAKERRYVQEIIGGFPEGFTNFWKDRLDEINE